ncbi:MAG: lytic transglycosylase domain-containing protein, partial [Acidobacteriota bacterium]
MEPGFSVRIVCLIFCLLAGGTTVFADELRLRNGRVIEADEVWETGEIVWYRQGKVIASVAKADLVRVTRRVADDAPKTISAVSEKPGVELNSDSKKAATGGKRKVSRLWLKDGTQIDADSVSDDSERIVYRLGNMQTHIERSEVVKVINGIEVADSPAPPSDVKLRFSTGNHGLDGLIVYNSTKYSVDPMLIYLVMREESGFNHRAISRVGARGLMQLMPATAARFGVRNIHDPVENVDAGTRYLRMLIDMFGGDINLALAGYNAGEGAVLKYGRRIPPYSET